MELQQQIVNDLSFDNKEVDSTAVKKISGRELFRFSFSEAPHYKDNHKKVIYNGFCGYLENTGFDFYVDSYTPEYFDHYFRHLYSILKFIDNNSELNDAEKYRYTSILRSTLSRYELVWMFYNGLSDYGHKQLKPLIEKYSMLNNLRSDHLALSKENMEVIEQSGLKLGNLSFNDYPITDYVFFVDYDGRHKEKYRIDAFYSPRDKEKGEIELNNIRKFFGGTCITLCLTPYPNRLIKR